MRQLLLILALGLAFVSGQSQADTIFSLNFDSCGGGCGNGQNTSNNNFGMVTLTQVSANQVSVTLQVIDPGYIVNTGSGSNHAPFAFNTDTAVTISNIADSLSTPSTYFTTGATNASVSGLGTFGYEIACSPNCANGASQGGEGTYLSFIVTANSGALGIDDFVANGNGFYFATDIIGPAGNTGEVAANQAPTITTGGGSPVPEPASVALLGSGLAALAGLRRRRIKSRN